MRVSTCREMLDGLPPGSSDFALFVANEPQLDARELAALENDQALPSLEAKVEHMCSGDLEPVLDVRVEEDTGEITIHTEQDAGAAGGVEGPIRVEALVSAAALAMSPPAELFWVGGLRPIGGDYMVRLALPIVGFARSEEDGRLIIMRSATPEDRSALTHWRDLAPTTQ